MTTKKDNQVWRQQLWHWFQDTPGKLVLEAERDHLAKVLPRMFGYFMVQLGSYWPSDVMETSLISSKCVIDCKLKGNRQKGLVGLAQELPIKSDSVDLVVLPHTLEFESDPHQILREAERILIPEGNVVILGFNPMSLWGIWRILGRWRGKPPWSGHFISLTRIKDWLALLGFEVSQKTVLFQRPPIRRPSAMNRLQFMEKFGNKWSPSIGAVYVIVAKKKDVKLTPIKPRWRQRARIVNSSPVAEGLESGQSS